MLPLKLCNLQKKELRCLCCFSTVPDVALFLGISLDFSESEDVYGAGMYGPVSGKVLFLPSTAITSKNKITF